MKKKISLLLCLVLVFSCIVGLLVACKPDNGPSDVLDKDRTINVYSWWDPTKPGIVGMKKGFEEKYKEYGVKLNFVMVGSYYETMMTKLAAGQDAIDVMMLASDQVPTFAKNGVIRPLTENVTEEYLNDLYPSVKSGLYYNNEVYAVARDVTTKAAIINKDLFAEKNVPIPGDDWTWDDFNRIIKALSDKPNQKWGFTYDNNADPLFPLFYLQNAKYFDAEKKESYLDTPEGIAAIKWLYDMTYTEKAITTIGDAEGYGKYPEAFTKGHVGVMFGGLSQVDKVETSGVNFKVLPLPKAKDGTQRSHTFLNCWTVPTKTSNTAWAWKVVEYFSGAEGQKIAVDSGMGLPGSKTADIKTWAEAKEYRHYFVEALNYAGTVPYPTGVNATRWQSEFIKQIADKIMNVEGLTAEKLEAAIIKMDNKLQYIFFGG